jgi:hypothetical protein
MIESLEHVKIVKFKHGVDVIAKVVFNEDDTLLLKDSMLFAVETVRGQQYIMMQPWLPKQLVNEDVALIHIDDVLTMNDPSEMFYEYYINLLTKDLSDTDLASSDEIKAQVDSMLAAIANNSNRLH